MITALVILRETNVRSCLLARRYVPLKLWIATWCQVNIEVVMDSFTMLHMGGLGADNC